VCWSGTGKAGRVLNGISGQGKKAVPTRIDRGQEQNYGVETNVREL
jgi:hypothetical protein